MSGPALKCLQCRSALVFQIHEQKIWYRCLRCYAGYVPIHFLMAILSEFEYNKFVYGFQQAQVKVAKNCPSCQDQMIKIFDINGGHHIEACTSCKLAWLDPLQGFKLKHDQQSGKDKKITIAGNTSVDPLFELNVNETDSGGFFSSFLRSLGLERLSEKYPVLAFIALAVISVFILKLILSILASIKD